MSSAVLSLALMLTATAQVRFDRYNSDRYSNDGYGTIRKDELDYQKEEFQHWWGAELNFKLADLPTEGKVPDFRVPYAGHDYPDRAGGTYLAMAKYDRAFNRGNLASGWEEEDISVHRNGRGEGFRRGLFGRIIRTRGGVPSWYGHCNGWTAAAIRHAEPQKSVVRNGVTFTPADIKGLLAEIYMYSATEHLGGLDEAINPATLHVSLANWLGLGELPIGMEAALGETVINYPIYAYKTKINKLSERQHEVQNTITYTLNIPREVDKGPQQNRPMYFHYVLDLDGEGKITGGRYYGDSARIDMLWTPLKPTDGGEKGNERGNPHVKIKEVLAIWRESVPEDIRKKWLNVDPTEEDRILPPEEPKAAEATASTAAGESAPAAATTVAAPAPATDAPAAPPAPAPATPAPATPAPATPAPPAAAESPSPS
jgi:Transglutaminase elicitor